MADSASMDHAANAIPREAEFLPFQGGNKASKQILI
jgi:hypothetical protein